ncbi:formin-binding protein 4-like [Topomyia yanbarensis]|uniref:formin-binding protein 4-like n=1 Tax=Topomyia yanbarensis TaxID=2498891 RepID=UPI00273B440F|nr:formin-binding protein 4-like [Topomyia yanbarensis]
MTSDAVLQQYLELCSGRIDRLGYQLASNAVLEWNGVTIRFSGRIVKFLRQKLHTGLVQHFSNACAVEPFEDRQTHVSTKIIPPENLVLSASPALEELESPELPVSPSTSGCEFTPTREDLSFETPPRTLPAAPHPPPVTAGRQFLPLSSDDEDDEQPSATKRTNSSPSPIEPRQNAYSELYYLEATGTVRMTNEQKHRGTRTTHHIPRQETSPDGSSQSQTPVRSIDRAAEKRTRLKISYRKHLRSQEIQFALIIYEQESTRSATVRRNLFCGEQQPTVDSGEETTSPTRRTNPASGEATPLPESPPTVEPEVAAPPQTSPVQPPGTPFKRRRVPPMVVGRRTSPRRVRGDEFGLGSTSSSSTSSPVNVQKTWPRKHHHQNEEGGSSAKNRKLANVPTTIRKPLRF